jgi:hypothetical protein
MRWKQANELKRRAIERLNSNHTRLAFYGADSEEYYAELRAINADLSKVPYYMRSYVNGYAECLRRQWFNESLVWCHREIATDRLFSIDKRAVEAGLAEDANAEIYGKNRGCEIPTRAFESHHYWLEASLREIGFGRAPKFFEKGFSI